MQFAKLLLASVVVAVASAVQISNPTFGTLQVGQPFNITWSGADGAVTLKLKNGPALAQNLVSTIASGLTGASGSFIWTPSSSLSNGLYNLEIDDSTNVPNYSVQFTINGGTSSSSSAGSTTTGSTTSTVSVTTTGSTSSSSTPFSNSTTTTRASSTSASRTGSVTSTTPSASPTGNSAAQLGSPFALVLIAFLAIAYLH